tara:strand:+ start:801 stop:1262 length:462 start_codon:yes stop_codon:yes gene_type:complete
MREKIMNKINSKDWKFHELLKLKEAAETVAEELYHELTPNEQLEMIWETEVKETGINFGSLFKRIVISKLKGEIMIAFQEKFESATVNFSNNPPTPTSVITAEKPATLTEKYSPDPMDDLIAGKDVIINENPSLEEKDGMVETRSGNVKVKRV